jgi:hypothetical protein
MRRNRDVSEIRGWSTGALAAFMLAILAGRAAAVAPVLDWDPAYMWQAGATPTNLPAGGVMHFVGTVSVFGAPLADLNVTMPATEYTFVGDGLVSQGTVAIGPQATQIYTTAYTGGTINVYADPTPDASFDPFPPNAKVPSTFENDPPPLLTGIFTRYVVTTNNFTAFQTGNIEGDIVWTGGTLIERFRASNGAICPGLFTGGATWNTAPGVGIPGYLFRHDGKIDLQCPVPTTKSTWGTLKQLYR